MNDSGRLIRMIYRINPNEALYEAIMTGANLGMQLQSVNPLKRDPTPPLPLLPTKDAPVSKISVDEKHCSSCFIAIQQGTFQDTANSHLVFCNKCSLSTSSVDYRRIALLLALSQLVWAALAI